MLATTCGNGVRDGAEACDSTDLAARNCTSLGYLGGTLACSPTCRYDFSGCTRSPLLTSATLATGQGLIRVLTVDSTRAYWVNNEGAVRSVSLAGGAPVTLSMGQLNPSGIAVDDEHVYVATMGSCPLSNCGSDGRVIKLPKAGGAPTVLADQQRRVFGIALSGDDLFLITGGSSSAPMPDGEVLRVAKRGGPLAALVSGVTPLGLAADTNAVYFSTSSGVSRVSRSGGAATTLTSQALTQLQVVGDQVLGARSTTTESGVFSMPLTGGTPSALYTSPQVLALTADQLGVVWSWKDGRTSSAPALISRGALAGGVSQVLVTGLSDPLGLAADATSVYWANPSGTLMVAPR